MSACKKKGMRYDKREALKITSRQFHALTISLEIIETEAGIQTRAESTRAVEMKREVDAAALS